MASIDELKSVASSKLGFARPNQFLVELPPVGQTSFLGTLASFLPPVPNIPGVLETGNPSSREMNLLCSNVSMPGKQISTVERRVGMENQKMAYGYAVEDVSMTFYLMNDYGLRKYFDSWISTVIDENTGSVGYKNDYSYSVKIHQLRKPQTGFSRNIGPLRGNLEIGGGSVYTVELLKAFPTQVQSVELSNELDGLVQLTIQMGYTRWQPVKAGLQNFISGSLNIA